MTEVAIDRLVLDLPGLDAQTARALALGIADGLAGARLRGDHERLTITLDATAADGAPGDLAAQIVYALLSRIG